jgi:hypothetical protein
MIELFDLASSPTLRHAPDQALIVRFRKSSVQIWEERGEPFQPQKHKEEHKDHKTERK